MCWNCKIWMSCMEAWNYFRAVIPLTQSGTGNGNVLSLFKHIISLLAIVHFFVLTFDGSCEEISLIAPALVSKTFPKPENKWNKNWSLIFQSRFLGVPNKTSTCGLSLSLIKKTAHILMSSSILLAMWCIVYKKINTFDSILA